MDELTPIIRWAQNGPVLNVTIDLSDAKNPDIKFDETTLKFKGSGHGAHGENDYSFMLEFYKRIDYKKSIFKCTDRNIQLEIVKQVKSEEWPRLLKQEKKPVWLRVDFDKWKVEDSEEEKEDGGISDQIKKISFEQKIKSEVDKAKTDLIIYSKIAWLSLYNMFQAVCYTFIFAKTVLTLIWYGRDAHLFLFEEVGELLLTCQLASFVEILNPLLRIVRTGIIAPLIQVCGRNFCLFILIVPEKSLHSNFALVPLVLAWSASEVIRYPFYLTTLHQYKSYLLGWLRYSAWIILYPMGMISEVLFIYQSIELADNRERWLYSLPNALNVSFSLSIFLKVLLCIYVPFAAYMLKHMWILRCRKIGGKRKAKMH